MSEETRPKEQPFNEHFRDSDPIVVDDAVCSISNTKNLVEIAHQLLTVPEARALRDWLNKVLPKDACKPGEHSYQDVPVCVHCGDRP